MQSRRQNPRSSLAKLASIAITDTTLIAVLVVSAITLVSSRAAYADHNSMYLVCPDPIREGNSGQMSVKQSGYRIVFATIFTHHGAYTAGPEDFVEYHGVRFETDSDDNYLRVPIVTEEDATPEHDETFAVGFMSDGVWHQCLVTIEDDDAPEITAVEISSRPVDRYAYRAGNSIDIIVNVDAKVDVEEGSMLSLYLGDGDESTWRGAKYHSGSGTRSLVFRYRVKPEDMDTDGISVSAAAVGDDRSPASGFSGNIYAEGTDVPINYAHPGVTGSWRQKVDGRPYVQKVWLSSKPPDGWEAYRANQVVEISFIFDTDVVVQGDVSMGIFLGLDDPKGDWDAAVRRANYLRGSGTDTLVFGYTVRPGDTDDKGIMIAAGFQSNGFGGDGTIKAKGTDVERNPDYLGTGHQPMHKVDTAAPAVTWLGITSRPANGEAYAAGEIITVEAMFNELIEFHGDVHLELDVGGVPRQAAFESILKRGFRNVLVFHYTLQEGDVDADGIGIGANRLSLNRGGIHDSAGNAAGLSHPVLAADPDHKVATSQ